MQLLLTGLPGSGKTTLLDNIITKYDCYCIISNELLGSDKERLGFEAKTSDNKRVIFAHKNKISSDDVIGDYRVDIDQVDTIFTQNIETVILSKPKLFILDEIGCMQTLSVKFNNVLAALFQTDMNVLATIRHGDEWTEQYTSMNNSLLFTLTTVNRNEIQHCIESTLNALDLLPKLSLRQRILLKTLSKEYLEKGQYIQFMKLYDHAIRYLIERRINMIGNSKYKIAGDHSEHTTSLSDSISSCDCELITGKGQYMNTPGECSHIQSIKLYLAS